MRGPFSILLPVILLSSLLFCEIEPRGVQAQGTVYIRSDGTIDPSSAPIVTVDNVTYTLIANVSGPIVIERSHITLDGAGYAVQGDGSVGSVGIRLDSRWNVTVRNMTITGWWYGIDAAMAYSCVISQNLLTSNMLGIRMYYFSSNNTFAENRMVSNNNTGIKLSMDSKQNVIERNRISENPFGIAITNRAAQNTVVQNLVARNDYGIWLQDSNLNTICHNDFVRNSFQTYCIDSNNTWDEDYPSGGNYWSDYTGVDLQSGPQQNSTGSDGIGDTPHIIDANNQDRYPLMPAWKDWTHYHNYTEITDTLAFLDYAYEDLVDVFSIGKSWENRDIYCIRLTNKSLTNPKPKVFFIGYHHAREPITAELPLYFAVKALSEYGENATITQLLDEAEIFIVPALNVDGFSAVQRNHYQRKNSHPFDEDGDGLLDEDPPDDETGDGYVGDLYYSDGVNSYFIRYEGVDDDGDGVCNEDWVGGVDLNRNYGYQWNASVSSGSDDPQDECFRGEAPFSEPETQAVRDLALQHDFKYAISFHSGAERIVYPWGYKRTTTPDDYEFREVAANLSALVGFPYEQAGEWYTTSGVWDDWMYGNRSTFALTCEIYENYSAWQTKPGPEPNTWWSLGVLQYFNPDPAQIEQVIIRWLPTIFYTAERAISEAHSVAVSSLILQKVIIGKGSVIWVNATIANNGSYAETFNVTLDVNSTTIETKENVALLAGETRILRFYWNTTTFDYGVYSLAVAATPPQGETHTSDNVLATSATVTVMGDVNGDMRVNITDAIAVSTVFGLREDQSGWRGECDLNGDARVNILDAIALATSFGTQAPRTFLIS